MYNSLIQIDEKKLIKCKDFFIYYNNLDSAEQTISEIFNDHSYQFNSHKKNPVIFDAGSNIGIATLFFKDIYPNSKIFCFEPDPDSFEKLKFNVSHNTLKDVTLINAALSYKAGEIDFFGQIFVDSPDTRGNSIIDIWGLQRKVNNTLKVRSVKLSSYINFEVDFLKLDIEGAEQQVLEELEQENKLSLIKDMAIEIHQCDKIKSINDIDVITTLLKRNHFDITIVKKEIELLLPKQIKEWSEKVKPQLFSLRAIKL